MVFSPMAASALLWLGWSLVGLQSEPAPTAQVLLGPEQFPVGKGSGEQAVWVRGKCLVFGTECLQETPHLPCLWRVRDKIRLREGRH